MGRFNSLFWRVPVTAVVKVKPSHFLSLCQAPPFQRLYIYPGAPGTEWSETGYYYWKRAHIHAQLSFHAPYTHLPFLNVYQNTSCGPSLRHIHGFMAATLLTMSAALAPGQDDFLSLLKPSLSDGFQEDSSLFSFEAKNPDTERGLSHDYSQVIG